MLKKTRKTSSVLQALIFRGNEGPEARLRALLVVHLAEEAADAMHAETILWKDQPWNTEM